MKKVFLESKYTNKFDFSKIKFDKLPKRIALFTTIQYIDYIEEIKSELEKNNIEVELRQTKATYPGQILGCTIDKFEGVDGLLYIGDGKFHPIALAIENEIPVYLYNPKSEVFKRIEESEIKRMKIQRKAAITKFFSSDEIGILISTKPGQNNFNKVQAIIDEYPEKKFYKLAFNTLDFNQLENFPFIECFVNTACARITYDDYSKFPKPIVEFDQILNFK